MMKWLLWGMRLVLAGVFIYAGTIKIVDPGAFANSIDNYRILPWFLVSMMAAVLPWIEVLCGIFLIWGKWIRGASFILIVLNAVFVIAIASALVRGLDIDCGCFTLSTSGSRVSVIRIIEDLGLMAMAWYVFIMASESRKC